MEWLLSTPGHPIDSEAVAAAGHKCGAHTCGANSGMGKSVPAFPWPTDDKSAPPVGVEPKFAIVDKLRLPADLKPGHWGQSALALAPAL